MKIRGPSLKEVKEALAADVPIAECNCGNQKPRTIEGEALCANCGGKASNQDRDPAKEPS